MHAESSVRNAQAGYWHVGSAGSQSSGAIGLSTDNEDFNKVTCPYEASAGSTTITGGGHTAVITYDGATDCSTSSTVTWTYDGIDRGTLFGVFCDVADLGTSSVAGAVGVAGLLAGMLGMRRLRRKNS